MQKFYRIESPPSSVSPVECIKQQQDRFTCFILLQCIHRAVSFLRQSRIPSKSAMTSRLILFGLLATCCLALVASLDQSNWVVPLIREPGSSRNQRDLLLGDDDEDFDFFNRQTQDAKEANLRGSFDVASFRPAPEDSSIPSGVRNSLMKLQLRSEQFLNVAQKAAYSAVNLLIAFSKLVEHSNDKFIVIAK